MTEPLWRQIQRKNVTSIDELADILSFTPKQRQKLWDGERFSVNIPRRLLDKVISFDDPILLQFMPLRKEQERIPGFVSEPLEEKSFCEESCLLRKYRGRALLLVTNGCGMHCRYCFRRHTNIACGGEFEKELAFLANDRSITEVILSGGDPLSLSDRKLAVLFDKLDKINHLELIRIHTRFPIGIPERITSALLGILTKVSKQVWIVIHSNHPRELDDDVLASMRTIRLKGVPVLNQSVLLKGVNDDVAILAELCKELVVNGVVPYYLHQLDQVHGAAHFYVEEEKGLKLIQELAKNLPGYAVPRYVREIPGEPYKVPIERKLRF